MSKQICKSGTSIGTLVCEAEYAQSHADYIHKFSIALKEANETDYWLRLLKDMDYIDEKLFLSLQTDNTALIALLTIKTLKSKSPQ